MQNVKFPRDVLREKSGACLDLAVFYAAAANAVGIKPYLAVVPGHCFPVFQLPEGGLIGIEATGVEGGLEQGKIASWEFVVKLASELLEKRMKERLIVLVDVHQLWARGVSNPELEPLPPDILSKWGIQIPKGGSSAPGPGPGPGPNTPQQPVTLLGWWQDINDGSVFGLNETNWEMYMNGQMIDSGTYRVQGNVITLQSSYTGNIVQFQYQFQNANMLIVVDQFGERSTLQRMRD